MMFLIYECDCVSNMRGTCEELAVCIFFAGSAVCVCCSDRIECIASRFDDSLFAFNKSKLISDFNIVLQELFALLDLTSLCSGVNA